MGIKGETAFVKGEEVEINRNEAFIGDVGAFKAFNNIESARKFKEFSQIVGTENWMSPEMRSAEKNNIESELLKSDIFSLGLIGFYCLDPIEFKKKQNQNKEFNKSESLLTQYLKEFRERVVPNDPLLLAIYYLMRCMVSFSHQIRPDIHLLYEYFSLLNNDCGVIIQTN